MARLITVILGLMWLGGANHLSATQPQGAKDQEITYYGGNELIKVIKNADGSRQFTLKQADTNTWFNWFKSWSSLTQVVDEFHVKVSGEQWDRLHNFYNTSLLDRGFERTIPLKASIVTKVDGVEKELAKVTLYAQVGRFTSSVTFTIIPDIKLYDANGNLLDVVRNKESSKLEITLRQEKEEYVVRLSELGLRDTWSNSELGFRFGGWTGSLIAALGTSTIILSGGMSAAIFMGALLLLTGAGVFGTSVKTGEALDRLNKHRVEVYKEWVESINLKEGIEFKPCSDKRLIGYGNAGIWTLRVE